MDARYRRRVLSRLQRPSPEKLVYSELSDDVDIDHNDTPPHHANQYEAEPELCGITSSTSSATGSSKGEKENSAPTPTPAGLSPLRSMYFRTVGTQRGSFQLLDDESDRRFHKSGTPKTPRTPRTPKTPKTPLNETPSYLFHNDNATSSSPLLGPTHLSQSESQSSIEAFHNISDIFKAALDAELTKADFHDPFAKVMEAEPRRELQRGRRSSRSSVGSRSMSGSRVSSADDCSSRPPRANRRDRRDDSPNKLNSSQVYRRSPSPTISPRVIRGSSMSRSPTSTRRAKPLSPSLHIRVQQEQQSGGSGGRDSVPFDERESRRRVERERILRLMNGLDALLVDTPKSSNELPPKFTVALTPTAAATAAATAKARAASAQERAKIKHLVHGLDQLLVDTPTNVREQGPSSFHDPHDQRRPPLSSSLGKERAALPGYTAHYKGANQAGGVSRGSMDPTATNTSYTETSSSFENEKMRLPVTIRTKVTNVSAITSRATESFFSQDSLSRRSFSSEATAQHVVENPTVSTLPSMNTMDDMLATSISSTDNASAPSDPIVEMAWNPLTPRSQVALLLQRSTSIDSIVGDKLKKQLMAPARTPPRAETRKDELTPKRSGGSSILLEEVLMEQGLQGNRKQIKQHDDQSHNLAPIDQVGGETKLSSASTITTTTTMESGPFLEIPDLQTQQVVSEITTMITQKSSDETAASGQQDASLTELEVSQHRGASDDKDARETPRDYQTLSPKIDKEIGKQAYTGTPVTVKTSTSTSTTNDYLEGTMIERHHDPPKTLQLPSLSTDDNNEHEHRCMKRNPSDEQPQSNAWMHTHTEEDPTYEQPHSKISEGNFTDVQQTDAIEAVNQAGVPVPVLVPTTRSDHRENQETMHGRSPRRLTQSALTHAIAVVSRPPVPSPVKPPTMNATPRFHQGYPSVRDRINAFTETASPQSQQFSPSHAIREGTTTGGKSPLNPLPDATHLLSMAKHVRTRSQGSTAVNHGAFPTGINSKPANSPDLQQSGSTDAQQSSSTLVGVRSSSEAHEQALIKHVPQPMPTLAASGAGVRHEQVTESTPGLEVQSASFLPRGLPPRQTDHGVVASDFQSPSRAQRTTKSYSEMVQRDNEQSVSTYLDEAHQAHPSYGAVSQEQSQGNEMWPTHPNQYANGTIGQQPPPYSYSYSSRSPILPHSRHYYKPSDRPIPAPRTQPPRTPPPPGYPSRHHSAAASKCDSNGSAPTDPYNTMQFANRSPQLSTSRLEVTTTTSGASSHPVARKVLARSIESQEAQFHHGTSEIVDRNLAATPVAKTKHSRYHRGGKFQDEAPVSRQSSSHNQAGKVRSISDYRRSPANREKEENASKRTPNSKERTTNKRRTSKETCTPEGTPCSRIRRSNQTTCCKDDDATVTTAAVTTVSEFTNISRVSNVSRASSSGGSSSEDDEDEDERTSMGGAFAQNVMGMFDGFKLPNFTNCAASTKGVIDNVALGAERACIKAPEMPGTSKAAKKKKSKRRRTKTASELASSIQRATSHRSHRKHSGEEPDGKHIF